MAATPMKDSIENALTHHAGTGLIRGWRRAPHQAWSGAPKWIVDLNPGVHVILLDRHDKSPYGSAALTTYAEARLFCAALASAEKRPHTHDPVADPGGAPARDVVRELARYRQALCMLMGLPPDSDPGGELAGLGFPPAGT
jgi:hypothetical protein